MMTNLVILISLLYAVLLFVVAWLGDRTTMFTRTPWLRTAVYSLALAVYCSSWTFYGAVGTAARYGIGYLPIYLGPLLMMLLGWRLMQRLAVVAQAQNTTSIADFIGSRFGRSQRLAAWVALIALVAAVPYLALQYKAVAASLAVLTNSASAAQASPALGDPALYVAIIMALFAILFGTRQVDASEHRPGLMLAVALESVVKLLALVMVGVFAAFWFGGHNLSVWDASRALVQQSAPVGFVGQTLLAFAAIVCLPRQFHVAIVECGDVADIRRARWLFGLYLLLISAMVLPIAAAGVAVFGLFDGAVPPDSFVLALPLAFGHDWLAVVAYIGGFSAATGMVIVVSVAISNMVSNDLIMPALLRRGWFRDAQTGQGIGNLAPTVLWLRRISILLLALATYGYSRSIGVGGELASLGLMSFAAVAQFAPALLGGLYWRRISRKGVELGLLAGFAVWAYTLLLPSLSEAGWLSGGWVVHGLFEQQWLRPYALFGLEGLDRLSHGTLWSLAINVVLVAGFTALQRPGIGEQLQAEAFLNPLAARRARWSEDVWQSQLRVADLQALAGRIVGEATARAAFAVHAKTLATALPQNQARKVAFDAKADGEWMHFTELLIAGAVGAASARMVMTRALQGSGMELAAVMAVLDEAGPELRFNRNILLATLENMDQGVSVVDSQMRLVAWNQRYQQLFHYPSGMLYVGRSVEDLIRYNLESGTITPHMASLSERATDVQKEIDKRIAFMQAGSAYVYERSLPDGQVIELRGRPLPDGGYVTSYTDITAFRHAEKELRNINETLEQRVTERTREAERAHESRTRFLTAISHDVLQPVHAARLFASALREDNDPVQMQYLAERVDVSLRSAEELLDGILDISRLNAGMLQTQISEFDIHGILQQLHAQYMPMAERRGLQVRLHARPLWVRSDATLLRRVLQNFLANALRYTRCGRILISARQRQGQVLLQVWDTGPGIPANHLRQIYDEFHRYEQDFDWDGKGLGLGLSICQRISALLGHTLSAQSRLGVGSVFGISVPLVAQPDVAAQVEAATAEGATEQAQASLGRLEMVRPGSVTLSPEAGSEPSSTVTGNADTGLQRLKVLCLDNDTEILAGMHALLHRWGAVALCAPTVDEAVALLEQQPAVILADYHLHDRLNGLQALQLLQDRAPHVRAALLTADGSPHLRQQAGQLGYPLLTKPLKPASLRAFLSAKGEAGVNMGTP